MKWLVHHHNPRQDTSSMRIYQVTDRLHDAHAARVPGNEIAATVSAWLAELGAHSSLADDLAHAVMAGDWPATCAIGEYLSVDVTIAA